MARGLLALALFATATAAGAPACGGNGARSSTDGPGAAKSDGAAAETPPPAGGVDAAAAADTAVRDVAAGDPVAADAAAASAGVVSVAAGTGHTCAVHQDGHVTCWGYGPFIAPGLTGITRPVSIAITERALAVAVGIQAACALIEGGTVRCWGDFGEGPLSPKTVAKQDGTPLAGVTQVAGGSVAFCALNPTGTYCWGTNTSGELGRPVDMKFPPLAAVLAHPGPRRFIAASVAILVHDGADLVCGWGNNDSGIVPGPRGVIDRPDCTDGLPDVEALSAGDGHVCARRGHKLLTCWGSNSGGQLGSGDENLVEVGFPGDTIALPADIRAVASGAYHTCALLETGSVLCWGSNEHGECGSPTSSPRFAPQPLAAAAPSFVSIASGAGAQHTCGVTADGSVLCWGYDNQGQLGSGATTEDADRYSATPLAVRF